MRYLLVFISVLLSSVLLANLALAKITVTRDQYYIYERIPLHYMTDSTKRRAMELGVDMLIDFLEELRSRNALPVELTSSSLAALDKAYPMMDSFIQKLNNHNVRHTLNQSSFGFEDLVPSAFFIHVGGKLSLKLGLGAGGSAAMGIVLVPYLVRQIALFPEDGEDPVSWALDIKGTLVGWGNVNVGAGVGGGAAIRVTPGVIWGPVNDPQDIVGLAVSASASVSMGVGANVKVGAINNWSKPGFLQYPFFSMGLEFGPSVEGVPYRFNVAYIIDGVAMAKTLLQGSGASVPTQFHQKEYMPDFVPTEDIQALIQRELAKQRPDLALQPADQ